MYRRAGAGNADSTSVHPPEVQPVTTARDIMTSGADYVDAGATLIDAAKKMASDDVGALPICENGKLKGMVTDRDIVVKVLAKGGDPGTTKVIDLIQGEAVTIGADDSVEEALKTMSKYQVRRLPVIDGTDLVGMVSQADVARNLPEEKVGELVEAISQ
jgi:CBS domain-containing protein